MILNWINIIYNNSYTNIISIYVYVVSIIAIVFSMLYLIDTYHRNKL